MFEVCDLLIWVVTQHCGTGLSSCHCFLSHSTVTATGESFLNIISVSLAWTGLLFSGGRGVFSNMCAYSVLHKGEWQPGRNACLNKKRTGNKYTTWMYASLFNSTPAPFCFYNAYKNIITHKNFTHVHEDKCKRAIFRHLFMSLCWHLFGPLLLCLFFPSPASRQLLMYLIYDTPGVCVSQCVFVRRTVWYDSQLYCWCRNAAPSDSPDDLPPTLCSTQWGDPTQERGQESPHNSAVFQRWSRDFKMEIDRCYPKCCHNTTLQGLSLNNSVSQWWGFAKWNEEELIK